MPKACLLWFSDQDESPGASGQLVPKPLGTRLSLTTIAQSMNCPKFPDNFHDIVDSIRK